MKKNYFSILTIAAMMTLSACFGGSDNSGSTNNNSGDDGDGRQASSGETIRRADGSVIRLGGYKAASPSSSSAPRFKAAIKPEDLPQKVDLRKSMSPVENQGELSSCTANASAGAYEYLLRVTQGVSDFDISRLFLYYNARALDGSQNYDDGAFIYNAVSSLAKDGVCSEKNYPYIENKVNQKPPQNTYKEALEHTISKYEIVPLDLNSWKSVLAEGYPIVFGLNVYESFIHPRNGRITMPKANETNHGGHAMCCVGYSDPDKVFIVRNSWGYQWGDAGYCYIPYDYMMNPKYNDGDSWVIYSVQPINEEVAEESWSDDGTSLFVEMEDEFSDMSDEDWELMCDELGEYDLVYRLGALYNVACWGDEDKAPEESKAAADKLKKLLVMFGLDYSPKKVLKHCENLWVDKDNFLEETVEILSKYLSEGARATIAADMLEICEADGDAADEERELVAGLVGDWLNDELLESYYSDYFDEEDEDEYDYYDEEDDYDYDYDDDEY